MKLIGYIRVSTQEQGESGLGLEAQVAAISAYTQSTGGELVKVYKDVESGRKTTRPQMQAAIAHAKRVRGKLVIAKMDRLARNAHFITGLQESKVDFVACDNPHANKLTIGILAVIAEHEADVISQRTKAALAAAKARGTLLGSARPDHWTGREDRRLDGALAGAAAAKVKRDAEAGPVYAQAAPVIHQMAAEGESLQAIADHLNAQGLSTVRGLPWNRMQVSRVLRMTHA